MDRYDIEGDLSSYGRMLINFQSELPVLDQQLERCERRLAFRMVQKEIDQAISIKFVV